MWWCGGICVGYGVECGRGVGGVVGGVGLKEDGVMVWCELVVVGGF